MTPITLTPTNIPAVMRELRLGSGITQTELAKSLFMTNAALCYWEKGFNRHGARAPRINQLIEWARALDMDVTITLTPK